MRIFQSANGIGIGVMLWMMAWTTPLSAAVVDVYGRVSDAATNEPIAGAIVQIYAEYDDAEPTATVESNGDGGYAWSGDLPTDGFGRLVASAFGHWPGTWYFDASPGHVETNFALSHATFAGIVSDAAGAPVANVRVQTWVRDADTSAWIVDDSTATAADGSYKLWAPPGTYRVCAGGIGSGFVQECYDRFPVSRLSDIDAATPVILGDGERRHDIDFALTAGASLGGSLTDEHSGKAIANADVVFELHDSAGELIDTGRQRTDASGAYRFYGVPSGTFYAAAHVSSDGLGGKQLYSGIDCPRTDCTPVVAGNPIRVVEGDSIDGIDFAFGPEALIRGRVVDAVDGAPIPDAWVMACYNSSFITLTHCYFRTQSDADGRYEIAVNVRPYYFVKVIAPLAYVDQVYPDVPCMGESCNYSGGSVIVESGDTIEGIDFAMRRSSTLAGRVLDSVTGAPVAGARIVGFGADDTEKWTAYTDQNGRYVGGKWFPDTYYVRADYGTETFSTCAVYVDRSCPVFPEPITAVAPTPVALAAEEHREDIDFMLTNLPIFADGFDRR